MVVDTEFLNGSSFSTFGINSTESANKRISEILSLPSIHVVDQSRDRDIDLASGMSSPLTSLSSLDELDDQVSDTGPAIDDINDLKVAQVSSVFFTPVLGYLTGYVCIVIVQIVIRQDVWGSRIRIFPRCCDFERRQEGSRPQCSDRFTGASFAYTKASSFTTGRQGEHAHF
jgi:hypothetical protein